MNIELLLKVKAAILEHPEHFDMQDWYRLAGTASEFADSLTEKTFCGTTACIGGWGMVLSGSKNIVSTDPMFFERACRLFDLDEGAGEDLFLDSEWPDAFQDAYDTAATRTERAQVAADYIDYFITQHT